MRDKKLEKLSREIEFLLKRSRKLRDDDSECRALIQKNGLSVVLVDRDYTIMFYSDFSRSISGAISAAEMEEGRNFFDFVSGSDADDCRESFSQSLQGSAVIREKRVDVPGGSEHWFSMFFNPFFTESGIIGGSCMAVMDITEQKRVEADLKIMEKAFQFSNSAIAISDLKGCITLVNPAFLELWGYSDREEVAGRPPGDFLETRGSLEEALAGLLKTGKLSIECRAMRKDGSLFYVQVTASVVIDSQGNPSSLVASLFDITKRRAAEKALKSKNAELEDLNSKISNHERFLTALLDSIPIPVFYKDSHCRYLGCNKAYTRMTGLAPDDIVGKTAREIWPQDFSWTYNQKDLELLENPSMQEYEYKIKSRSGEVHDIIYCKNVFRNEKNEIAGIVGTFSEITDLKKTEQALKASEEQFRLLYEKAPIGYQSLDPSGRLIIVNQIWLDTLGYKKEEVIGRSFTEFMTEDSREIFNEGLNRIRMGADETSSELQLKKKGGEIIDASFNGITIRDAAGHFLKTHCVFIDISKDKEILRNLRKVAGQAKALKGFIPICAGCQMIQDLEKKEKPWVPAAQYISERLTDIRFSHGMCPKCIRKWYPDYKNGIDDK